MKNIYLEKLIWIYFASQIFSTIRTPMLTQEMTQHLTNTLEYYISVVLYKVMEDAFPNQCEI